MNTLANQDESESASGAEALDEPLTNRAFFLGVSYLTRIIEAEGAIARNEPPSREPYARMLETFGWLCATYLETGQETQALLESVRREREREKTFQEFNSIFKP
jgi:hypothetical protein